MRFFSPYRTYLLFFCSVALSAARVEAAPTISITAPADGSIVTSEVLVTADAADLSATISSVQFIVNGVVKSTDITSFDGFSFRWDTNVNPSPPDGKYTAVLTARAFNDLGQSTLSSPITVTVDMNAPYDTVITDPASGSIIVQNGPQILSGVIAVKGHSNDNVGVQRVNLVVDGVVVATDTTVPYSFSYDTGGLSTGYHRVGLRSTDFAGNNFLAFIDGYVDPEYPMVQIQTPDHNQNVSGSVSVTASASDNAGIQKVELYLDGTFQVEDNTPPYSFSWDSTTGIDGSHWIGLVAVDSIGNRNGDYVYVNVVNNLDVTPPTVQITSPTTGAVLSKKYTLRANAADANGISRVQFIVDGVVISTDPLSPYEFEWDTKDTPNGAHTLSARAFDAQGNNAADSIPITTSNDQTPPQITVSAPVALSTVSAQVTVQGTATDNVSVAKIQFFVDSVWTSTVTAGFNPFSFTWDSTGASNGAHTLQLTAIDDTGNPYGTAFIVYVNNDSSPPAVSLLSPVSLSTVTGQVPLSA